MIIRTLSKQTTLQSVTLPIKKKKKKNLCYHFKQQKNWKKKKKKENSRPIYYKKSLCTTKSQNASKWSRIKEEKNLNLPRNWAYTGFALLVFEWCVLKEAYIYVIKVQRWDKIWKQRMLMFLVGCPALFNNFTHFSVVLALILTKQPCCFRVCWGVWIWIAQ